MNDWKEIFWKKYHIEDDWDFELYQKVPNGWRNVNKEVFEFIQSEIRKAKEEQRERIKEIVSIEIEAWFGAHDEMEKSFMSEDMIKQIVKRMEEV